MLRLGIVDCDVWIDKPFTTSVADAVALVEAAQCSRERDSDQVALAVART